MPALQTYIIESIWEQFCALMPELFGCAYWRISDEGCSVTTLRRRRDEWIELGAMDALEKIVRDAYDRIVGLELGEVAVDCCITKAPCGGEKAGRSPVDRGKRGIKRSVLVDAKGIPRHPARGRDRCRCWHRRWTPPGRWVCCRRGRASVWIVA